MCMVFEGFRNIKDLTAQSGPIRQEKHSCVYCSQVLSEIEILHWLLPVWSLS